MKNPQELHRALGLIREARAIVLSLSDEEWFHYDSLPKDHPDKTSAERCAEELEDVTTALDEVADALKAAAY